MKHALLFALMFAAGVAAASLTPAPAWATVSCTVAAWLLLVVLLARARVNGNGRDARGAARRQ